MELDVEDVSRLVSGDVCVEHVYLSEDTGCECSRLDKGLVVLRYLSFPKHQYWKLVPRL